jgi:malate dehydrogenase (oxaloacetate-decarboxylating)
MSLPTLTRPSSSPTEPPFGADRPSPDLDGRSMATMSGRLPAAVVVALVEGRGPVPVPLRGRALLAEPLLYKGAATPGPERIALGMEGLLPPGIIDIEQQVSLELEHIRRKQDPLERYIGLAATHERNETLFFRLLAEHLEEFMPIVYTPTVGRACQEFSHIMRRPRGLWISPADIDRIPDLLANAARGDVRLIVATDNERILGLGDQGAGGMPIPIGKLALYTAAAGIHPSQTLPVSLDVGTDRETLLSDPLYLGWHGRRLRGPEYDAVVEAFVTGVRKVFPHAILQWEDFKQHNALRLLDRYRDRLATFNDDIQGTGGVVLGGILAGLRHLGVRLRDQRFVLAGSGAAGIGIARLLTVALLRDGASAEEARRSIALLDSHGLVYEGRPGLDADKLPVAWTGPAMAAAGLTGDGPFDLETVVRAVHPTVLLGTTGTPGTFNRRMLRAMADATPTPIVLPLSNPTANTEATPSDILAWTGGRALVATGSPFDPVPEPDGDRVIGQANNVYVFPGVGLGAIVAHATAIPDIAFLRAAETLASMVSDERLATGALYPPVASLREVSRAVAIAVVRALRDAGAGLEIEDDDVPVAVDAAMWWPDYLPYEPV